MIQLWPHSRLLGPALAAGALLLPGLAHGQGLAVSATVSPFNGVFYHYNYSVTNNTTQGYDYPDITLAVPAQAGAIQNLFAPTGFNAFFDSVQGTLDFAEDTSTFAAGTTVAGWQFDSPLAPASAAFTAPIVDANGLSVLDAGGNQVFVRGTTLAPAPPSAAVPEPGTLALGLVAAPALFLLARRRRAPVNYRASMSGRDSSPARTRTFQEG